MVDAEPHRSDTVYPIRKEIAPDAQGAPQSREGEECRSQTPSWS